MMMTVMIMIMMMTMQEAGTWSGSSPSCSYVDCGVPEIIQNGEVKLKNNGTSYGAMAFYSCQSGFKLKGEQLEQNIMPGYTIYHESDI